MLRKNNPPYSNGMGLEQDTAVFYVTRLGPALTTKKVDGAHRTNQYRQAGRQAVRSHTLVVRSGLQAPD